MYAASLLAVLFVAFEDPHWKTDWDRMKSIRPRQHVVHRAKAALKIDGKLDDAAWQAVPFTEDFVDIEGDRKPKPRFRTRMKFLWDDQCLYIGADLEEPHVWATLTKRDSVIFQDNDFEIFLDPDGDNHEYFEFEMNALNTGWDLRLTKPYRDGGKAINEWDIVGIRTAIHVKGTINDPRDRDEGWSLEIAIPWSGIKQYAGCPCPPRDGDLWRFDASRVEWDVDVVDGKYQKVPKRPEHNWVWSPQGVIDMHRPERWGWIQFSNASAPPVALRTDPTFPAREVLHKLYYRQRAFQLDHKRFATSLAELGWTTMDAEDLKGFAFARTPAGYTASVDVLMNGGARRLQIEQDSRIRLLPAKGE